jgi:MoaA/NifB/PqqE/SkfB family radical SAM enzyme
MSARQQEERTWKFSEITADPLIRERWQRVRRFFFLRESTYDMTNRCNIRCEGCYYFKGDKQFAVENRDPEAWRQLMVAEKERGITFVVLAGAEPSLVPELCEVCHEVIPLGAIASNGIKPLPARINYKIHISVWGNDESSLAIRKAKDMLATQMANYQNDPRVVFVYTFTPGNIEQCGQVTKELAANGQKITFNMFSAPEGYHGPLRHTPASLARTGEVMSELLKAYPETVLFSPYSIVAHTHAKGLHDLYGCSYPRRNPTTDVGLGRTFRQYRTDLTWNREAACCVPDTDCADCRHYAAGSAVVTARLYRHASNPTTFAAWLDYVDTYLAVWVMGYDKGQNLRAQPVQPPEIHD